MSENNAHLAKLIARKIFACGDEPGDPCQRIQLMGGTWPNNEHPMGGFNERAMADFLEIVLDELLKDHT